MVKPKQSNPAGSPHLDKAVWNLTEECIEESTANKKKTLKFTVGRGLKLIS